MGTLSLLVDEHVDRAYRRALASNGYAVAVPDDDYERGLADEALLEQGFEAGQVLLTNDRDFVRLHDGRDHAGVVVYTDHSLSPGDVVSGVRQVDRPFGRDGMANRLVWLDQWVPE